MDSTNEKEKEEKQKQKYIEIVMQDGTWRIPLDFIADARATYYANYDSKTEGRDYLQVYNEEYEYTMKDSYEAIDFFSNNYNWSDIEHVAIKVKDPDPITPKLREEMFREASREIVEV